MIKNKGHTKKVYLQKKLKKFPENRPIVAQKKRRQKEWLDRRTNIAGGKVESNNTPEIPD